MEGPVSHNLATGFLLWVHPPNVGTYQALSILKPFVTDLVEVNLALWEQGLQLSKTPPPTLANVVQWLKCQSEH